MNIKVKTVPHERQRYNTVGDWHVWKNGSMDIIVSDLGDWRANALVAIHELVEVLLCRQAGVSALVVDEFDMAFKGEGEPGDDPQAPYHAQHQMATVFERLLATQLGVNWQEYEKKIAELG